MGILIRNGRLLDPLRGRDGKYDVLIEGERIVKIEEKIEPAKVGGEELTEIDAAGSYVMAGFIDLHVHLRDPGFEYKETLRSGGRAAAKGGVTTMCAMPNTKPVIDSGEKAAQVHRRAREECLVNVIQLGAVTVGQLGKELADIEGMAAQGCHGITEDGRSVMDSGLYREAMRRAKENGLLIFAHCEDRALAKGGVMNAGKRARELQLKGISNSTEDVIAARDILLAKETGAGLHLCHCSTRDSVKLIRLAKEEGLRVTGEVCPHHFTLCDEDIERDDGNFKMNPPLRGKEDKKALREGLKSGVIDVISTDHAPHSKEEKARGMRLSPFGVTGLETVAALTYTELVETGVLTMMQMAEKTSYNPSKILGLEEKGSVSEGKTADVIIFDPRREYRIDREDFVSKGKNTPFQSRKVKGEVRVTIVGGKIVYRGGRFID